jgi:hypothetical protein
VAQKINIDNKARFGYLDGVVGPLTKIILYREKNTFEMPYLTQ